MDMLPRTMYLIILLGSIPILFAEISTTEKLDLSIFDDYWKPSTKEPTPNSPPDRESTRFVGNPGSVNVYSPPLAISGSYPSAHSPPVPLGAPMMPSNLASSGPPSQIFTPTYLSPFIPQNWPLRSAVMSHTPQHVERSNIPKEASLYSFVPPAPLSPVPSHHGNAVNPSMPFIPNIPQSVHPMESYGSMSLPNALAPFNPIASFSFLKINDPYVYSQPVTYSGQYSPSGPGPIVASFVRTYDLPLVSPVPGDASSLANFFVSSPLPDPSRSDVPTLYRNIQPSSDYGVSRTDPSFSAKPSPATFNSFLLTFPGSHPYPTNNLLAAPPQHQQINQAINNPPIYYRK